MTHGSGISFFRIPDPTHISKSLVIVLVGFGDRDHNKIRILDKHYGSARIRNIKSWNRIKQIVSDTVLPFLSKNDDF